VTLAQFRHEIAHRFAAGFANDVSDKEDVQGAEFKGPGEMEASSGNFEIER
jgi:hypothetical protein